MPKAPRALVKILKFSGAAAALVARVRDQSALLALIKRELDPPLKDHVLAALLRDKQLILYADSSAWASRLRFYSRTLRSRLTGENFQINKITVRITLRPEEKRRTQGGNRKLSLENSALIEQTADAIDDASLRQALKRLSRHGH
ncbi:MAG: DUF721 domain-containing protein [Gammaproteobacteria bacterium]|nr:DUF721 domain-containing protein [Gammaproteobacteria bacterium]